VLTAAEIGKETNLVEQQEEGLLLVDPQEVYESDDRWGEIQRWLSGQRIDNVAAATGIGERLLRKYRVGQCGPSHGNLRKLIRAATNT
jgi:hypothetical protein